ncbi:SDR family NAD(P)-dependent oxidoreductase [Micromonospora sp. MED01]|uniref:oxidoreductase n=1 Tax=Micromonospora alfalfae TaxID=2911212 RepID=UPI001EE7D7C2|nr:oxidoreductase [Micromonospora alfalfae]MCG5466650.1 SDR family NAD(P)-dependent oxidoreductase [Micromonospora alfalfae]
MNQPLTMPTDQPRLGGEREAASGLRSRAALRAANDTQRAPNQAGKIAVITGANAGIGYQAARQLAAAGATVVLACRHPGRMAEAARAIRKEFPNAAIDEVSIDLGSLRSIRAAASIISDSHPHVDILINNAGVIGEPGWRTLDGFESCFGVNHLGHFALTGLLLDKLIAAADARIVTVSSTAHRVARLNPQEWPSPQSPNIYHAYAASKLANLLFAYHLHSLIAAAGIPMRSIACQPGWAATRLLSPRPRSTKHRASVAALQAIGALIAQPAEDGAQPLLRAATADVPSGVYLGPSRWWRTRGPAAIEESSANSHDAQAGRLLWDLSVELCGVDYSPLAGATAASLTLDLPGDRGASELRKVPDQPDVRPEPLVLPDGEVLAVRPSTAADVEAVEQLHRNCSNRSRHQRYMGGSSPTPEKLRRLHDPPQGLTLLVTEDRSEPGQPIIAVANLIAQGADAEICLLVRDDWQRRGIGTGLLRRLLDYAEKFGRRSVVMHVQSQNAPMLRTVAQLGRRSEVKREGSVTSLRIPLTAAFSSREGNRAEGRAASE